MKRIQAACLQQTIHFQLKDGVSTEWNRKQVRQEYENYKAHLEQSHTKYKIVDEIEQPDGSLIVKIKKQNNAQPVGDYLGEA